MNTARIFQIQRALEEAGLISRPVYVLDLDAFDANVADLARRAAGRVPIRVASKSLRVRTLIDRALAAPGYAGILSFTLREALWLVEHGASDVVVAYPTADREAVAQLAGNDAARAAITLMVDETAHLNLIESAVSGAGSPGPVRVAIELDVAYEPVRGVRFGALRSPVSTAEQAGQLAQEILARPAALQLVGMMAYEGQIAGVTDSPLTPYNVAVRTMKRLSAAEVRERRAEAVAVVRAIAPLEFVNGGGTGSIETTASEAAVTEVAAGSGLIGPGLFDHYQAFSPEPALLIGVDVVRRPASKVATLLGGGWIASGVPGQDRLPTIHYPQGLKFSGQEAAGEVQTPVIGDAADDLRVGDTVWLRHAKAGEPAEHAQNYVLIQGNQVVDSVPTYRGEGKLFL